MSETTTKTTTTSKWGRDRLPHKQTVHGFSLWAILKGCLGRELHKITMPVEFNEPLSFLQRIAECVEHVHLLRSASIENDPVRRMQLVAAFAVASVSGNFGRLKKPFNPMLGETYELDRSDQDGFRYMSEQVCHHPPISAFYCEGTDGSFEVVGHLRPRTRIWGRTIEIHPEGDIRVKFPKRDNEEYVWTNVDCFIHNIILGTIYLEQHGEQIVKCKKNNLYCRIDYKAANGPRDIQLHSILGCILNKDGQKLSKITGRWPNEVCVASMADEKGQTVWQATARPSFSDDYYGFSTMTMAINEMPADSSKLARTDSRFRMDIRLLENGDLAGSATEKHRLEEKQRQTRKERMKNGKEWTPLWFEKTDTTWEYLGKFWDRPKDKCLPDLF